MVMMRVVVGRLMLSAERIVEALSVASRSIRNSGSKSERFQGNGYQHPKATERENTVGRTHHTLITHHVPGDVSQLPPLERGAAPTSWLSG